MKPKAQSFVAAIRNAPCDVGRVAALAAARQIDPQVRITSRLPHTLIFKFTDGTEARTQLRRKLGGLYAYTTRGKTKEPTPCPVELSEPTSPTTSETKTQ